MEKNYGIKPADLERLLDQFVMKSGDTVDVSLLREGIEQIIYANNDELIKDIKKMIDERSS